MARKHSKSSSTKREAFDFPSDVGEHLAPLLRRRRQPYNQKLAVSVPVRAFRSEKVSRRKALQEVSDERRYHPTPRSQKRIHDVRNAGGQPIKLVVGSAPRKGRKTGMAYQYAQLSPHIAVPPKAIAGAIPCIRRKIRKEVLFAKRLTGKGAGASRHRAGPYSHIRC